MSSQHTAVLLCNLPAQTLAKVSVAETLELVPTWLALLDIWKHHGEGRTTRLLNVLMGFQWFLGVLWAFITQNIDTTFKQLTRSNFHCKKKKKKKLTSLTEVPCVCWQAEASNLPVPLSTRSSVETGVICTGI